jgi:hypothetical protein
MFFQVFSPYIRDMKRFSVEDTIAWKEKSMGIPGYEHGKPWIVNGRDLVQNEYDFLQGDIKVKVGQHFLYETIKEGAVPHLSYPKLGIYLNDLPCDQTIELEWFDIRRTWEHMLPCSATDIYGKEFTTYAGNYPSEIRRMILWDDTMLVYGAWNGMPSWKELRRAYEKTLWFAIDEQAKRDRTLRSILP